MYKYFSCTPRITPAFSFPAEAGTYLSTPEGWKAELAFGGWLVIYRNKCPRVDHSVNYSSAFDSVVGSFSDSLSSNV